jgi:hypothetical protein
MAEHYRRGHADIGGTGRKSCGHLPFIKRV